MPGNTTHDLGEALTAEIPFVPALPEGVDPLDAPSPAEVTAEVPLWPAHDDATGTLNLPRPQPAGQPNGPAARPPSGAAAPGPQSAGSNAPAASAPFLAHAHGLGAQDAVALQHDPRLAAAVTLGLLAMVGGTALAILGG
jgi:hypothetical protein